jgi:hypothetical protein
MAAVLGLAGVAAGGAPPAAPPAPPPRIENAYWTDAKGELPTIVLEKAGLRLTVLRPDPATFLSDRWSEDYGGTRFDHSGRIALAEFRGHTFIGRWTEIAGRRVPMYSLGTSEEYKTNLAIDPTPPETRAVIRIGVGRMGRTDPNGRWTIAPAPWEVQSGPDWIEFRQAVAHPSGWGYHLVKRLTLADRPGEFRFDRRLRNTGTGEIAATFYCHNWFGIDGVGIGPDYRVRFPFRPKMEWGKWRGGGQIVGQEINFLGPVTEPLPGFYARFAGRWDADENRVTIEQTRSGACVRIVGDWPVSLYGVYATREEICPEPHFAFRLAPGDERSWATTYTLMLAHPPEGSP